MTYIWNYFWDGCDNDAYSLVFLFERSVKIVNQKILRKEKETKKIEISVPIKLILSQWIKLYTQYRDHPLFLYSRFPKYSLRMNSIYE